MKLLHNNCHRRANDSVIAPSPSRLTYAHISVLHDAERLPRRMKRGTDACARQGWPDTPAALNRQSRTAPPDRAGGVLCGAEVKEEKEAAGRRRGTWSAAERPGGPIAAALPGFPIPSLTPPKFTPGMEEYGSCQRCVHTLALKGEGRMRRLRLETGRGMGKKTGGP